MAVSRSGRRCREPVDIADLRHEDFLLQTTGWCWPPRSRRRTSHLVDAGMLDAMPRQAWLVNVARGAGDHRARSSRRWPPVASPGRAGRDRSRALPDDHPLWGFDNVIITPHVANTWDMASPPSLPAVEPTSWASPRPALEGQVDVDLGY